MANETTDIKQSLQDYVATANSGKYKNWDEINSKFPEFNDFDKKVLQDYVATANSGKYKSYDEINSKFPELGLTQAVKKKEFAQPSTDFSAASQFSQQIPTTTRTPYLPGAEEKIKETKSLEGEIKKQKGVVELTELLQKPFPSQKPNLPDFNLNVVNTNPIDNRINKINKAIEINKLQALEKAKEKKDLQNTIDIDNNENNLSKIEGDNMETVQQ